MRGWMCSSVVVTRLSVCHNTPYMCTRLMSVDEKQSFNCFFLKGASGWEARPWQISNNL